MALHVCAVHEQRPVYARCMSCRKMLCQECATQWDGIWHCAQCLGARRGAQVERSPLFGWIAVVLSSLILLYAGARALVWTSAMIAGLF
jgi:B-box zinc finger